MLKSFPLKIVPSEVDRGGGGGGGWSAHDFCQYAVTKWDIAQYVGPSQRHRERVAAIYDVLKNIFVPCAR